MKKGELIQKLVLFGAMTVGALLIAESYIQARAFVGRVDAADGQIAQLKQEVEYLRVQLDVSPRPIAQLAPQPVQAIAMAPQSLTLPLPEPMRFPSAGTERPPRQSRGKDAPAPGTKDELEKADAVPDDGKVVLMKDAKESKPALAPAQQQEVAAPTVDVKLWTKK